MGFIHFEHGVVLDRGEKEGRDFIVELFICSPPGTESGVYCEALMTHY